MEKKLYYFLEDSDKLGPYTKDEIIKLNLKKDTLVYNETQNKWLPLNKIEELDVNSEVKNKKKIILNSSKIYLILFFLSFITSLFLTEVIKSKNYNNLISKIELILEDKDEVCDYMSFAVSGDLVDSNDILLNDNKEIYQYFFCNSGGWEINTITRQLKGYDIEKKTSGTMGYKIPEFTKQKTFNTTFSLADSILVPSDRYSVEEVYSEALASMTKGNENMCYKKGSYKKIENFGKLKDGFYSIENVKPPDSTNSIFNGKAWESSNDPSITNSKYVVWYKNEGKHYEIILDTKKYYESLSINTIITFSIIFTLFFIWKKRNNFEFKID